MHGAPEPYLARVITVRKSEARGHASRGWLESWHTFTFADYHDPNFMGFRSLRVLNEDWIQPAGGFGTHPHRDMEIITYVVEGALQHSDSLGNGEIIVAGEIQVMSAGTGVLHSEYNPSPTEPVHILQIWIEPEEQRIMPSYAKKRLRGPQGRGQGLLLIASPDGQDQSAVIHQDARVYAAFVSGAQPIRLELGADRFAWVQVIRGTPELNGHALQAGDGAAVSQEPVLLLSAREPAELLVFDLA